jgi:hypothetical protein
LPAEPVEVAPLPDVELPVAPVPEVELPVVPVVVLPPVVPDDVLVL